MPSVRLTMCTSIRFGSISVCLYLGLLIPIQTTFEELLYRGYLGQDHWCMDQNRWLVVMIIPAICLGCTLCNPEIKEYRVLDGPCLGILCLDWYSDLSPCFDDSIEVSMGLRHAQLNNILHRLRLQNKASVLRNSGGKLRANNTPIPTRETLALLCYEHSVYCTF